jgi:acyl dehydratase
MSVGPRLLAADLASGAVFDFEGAETVTAARELARLTLNVATAHTDATGSAHGRRLDYGRHTISVAAAHVTRALPRLATIVAWASCDHLGPVFEGDKLRTDLRVEGVDPAADGGLVDCGRWCLHIARMMRRRPSWTRASWRWWPERVLRGGSR